MNWLHTSIKLPSKNVDAIYKGQLGLLEVRKTSAIFYVTNCEPIEFEFNNPELYTISYADETELEQLRLWKESAMKVMPDMQAIGKELKIKLGESIHDKILPEIIRLKGLIRKAWFGNGMDCDCLACTAHFNNFKKENNI